VLPDIWQSSSSADALADSRDVCPSFRAAALYSFVHRSRRPIAVFVVVFFSSRSPLT
jgi:hypothetical protein